MAVGFAWRFALLRPYSKFYNAGIAFLDPASIHCLFQVIPGEHMKRSSTRTIESVSAALGLAVVIFVLAAIGHAQNFGPRRPVASDWSHQNVVFSGTISVETARKVQKDPRYWMQVFSRNAEKFAANNSEDGNGGEDFLNMNAVAQGRRSGLSTETGGSRLVRVGRQAFHCPVGVGGQCTRQNFRSMSVPLRIARGTTWSSRQTSQA
jgi:hypothetical protein